MKREWPQHWGSLYDELKNNMRQSGSQFVTGVLIFEFLLQDMNDKSVESRLTESRRKDLRQVWFSLFSYCRNSIALELASFALLYTQWKTTYQIQILRRRLSSTVWNCSLLLFLQYLLVFLSNAGDRERSQWHIRSHRRYLLSLPWESGSLWWSASWISTILWQSHQVRILNTMSWVCHQSHQDASQYLSVHPESLPWYLQQLWNL